MDYLNIQQIADSGQIFRFNFVGDDKWELIAGDKYWLIDTGKEIMFPDAFWEHYFDMETDYGKFIKAIPKSDKYLTNASMASSGIRILNQDPWEMLISFIISQRKSIPAIKTSIEKLCAKFGTLLPKTGRTDATSASKADSAGSVTGDGSYYYAFPTPEQLSKASLDDLQECSLGYRAPYVYEAAQKVARGDYDLAGWRHLPDEELRAALMSIKGVGIKVANCVMLFGYHRIGAFPVDVWIQRIMDAYYEGRFPVEKYPGYAGVMQQYMFFYERTLKDRL